MSSWHEIRTCGCAVAFAAAAVMATPAWSQHSPPGPPGAPGEAGEAGAATPGQDKPDFPPFDTVAEGLDKVVSTADGQAPLYALWEDRKTGRLLAELPKDHEEQLVLVATTVAAGDEEAGVMGGSIYATWKRFDKRVALVEPNFLARSSGDQQSKDSIDQLFRERVILDVPIVTMGPGGGPVIDLRHLMVDQHAQFFGPMNSGFGPWVTGVRAHLATLTKAKAFPRNVEIVWDVPRADGHIISLHYSVLGLEPNADFKPRLADNRVGYFNVYYNELGKPGNEEPFTRYITRWHLEKADPKLKLSPAKRPIVWYVEHTTPVRYRRFVREGILAWNKAFRNIGILDAVEVYQQDSSTGAHMDKDPEDARYNFFRWNTSTQGYAIGPSRFDPRTGEIIDADVVWHAGLTEAVMTMLKDLSGDIAVLGMHPETLAWLAEHPEWDPRVRLASPARRARQASLAAQAAPGPGSGDLDEVQAAAAVADPGTARALLLRGRVMGQTGGACRIGDYLAMNINLFSAALAGGLIEADPEAHTLDDLPEAFLGGMIRYISAHEVGHTLGLQHNFGASTIRALADINSEAMAGQPFIGSVMEYAGVNINDDDGEIQGQYATPGIGPYDEWAIAFGYGPEDERDAILARVAEPDHVFLNDIATIGPDPRAMVWDMGADPLQFAESRLRIIEDLRGRIVDEIVKDGQPWKRARDRYEALLSNHMLSLVVASRWVGGSFTNWDYKGDPGDRDPVENVDPERQRRALKLVIENSFRDEAFGLTPELLHKLGIQYWPDAPGFQSFMEDPSYQIHDTVAGVQASALTMLVNPTKLRRLYDNEYRTNDRVERPITMAEVVTTVTDAVWGELADAAGGEYTTAKPMVSSLRRNLQREHLERLIALSMPRNASSPAMRTIATLSIKELGRIRNHIANAGNRAGPGMDAYTAAHLADARTRIDKALDAVYVYR